MFIHGFFFFFLYINFLYNIVYIKIYGNFYLKQDSLFLYHGGS